MRTCFALAPRRAFDSILSMIACALTSSSAGGFSTFNGAAYTRRSTPATARSTLIVLHAYSGALLSCLMDMSMVHTRTLVR